MYNYQEIKHTPVYWQEQIDKEEDSEKLKSFKSIKEDAELAIVFVDELRDLVENQGYTFDLKGHDFGSNWDSESLNTFENVVCSIFSQYGGSYLYKRFKDDKERIVKIGSVREMNCQLCGKKYLELWLDKDKKRMEIIKVIRSFGANNVFDSSPCENADIHKPYSIEINIPSGKMLFANHFHNWYDWITIKPSYKKLKYNSEYSINNFIGRKKCTEMQAQLNCAEFNIGNCACRMYQMNDDKTEFMVGGYDEVEYQDENDEWQVRYPMQDKGARLVGDVCTDYWGYYVVDKDDFIDKAGKKELVGNTEYNGMNQWNLKSNEYMTVNEVECEPGRYRFTHVYEFDEEQDGVEVYTKIERIGDCV